MKSLVVFLLAILISGCASVGYSPWGGPIRRGDGTVWDGNVNRTNTPAVVVGGGK